MLKHVFLIILFILWSYSYYMHFVDIFNKNTMTVLLSTESIRDFSLTYSSRPTDLFAMSASNRRSLRMGVLSTKNPFQTFREHHYNYLLMVDALTPLHIAQTSMVVRYVKHNQTVASHWPRLETWPSQTFKSSTQALKWYKGPVVTSYL